MSRRCDLTGVGVMSGHNVSHSKRRTKRKFVPNLQKKAFKSDVLGSTITLNISLRTLRTITKYGGLDAFLINYRVAKLTDEGKTLRKKVKKALIKKGELDKVKIKKEKKERRVSARKIKVAKKNAKKVAGKVEKAPAKKVAKVKKEEKKSE